MVIILGFFLGKNKIKRLIDILAWRSLHSFVLFLRLFVFFCFFVFGLSKKNNCQLMHGFSRNF